MRLTRKIAHRCRSLFRRSNADAELRAEIDLHIQQLTKEHMLAGMRESEARLAALREFGSMELTKEHCRDMRRVHFVDDLLQDLAFAFRLLAKSPGFTLTAVLSLALAIGANTAIFSLVDAVLMRMLPVRDPRQLVELTRPGGGTLSYPMYQATRDRNQVFSGVLSVRSGRSGAGVQLGGIDLGDVYVSPVSGDYFAVLGVSPVIGRVLTEEDLASFNAVVISYGLWQRSFAGDPAALGKALRMGGHPYTIVGVAPAGFTGVATGQPVDLWVPITWVDRQSLQNPGALMFRVMARRKPGVSEEQARANMEVLARQWSTEWKFEQPMPVEVTPASGGLTELRRRFSRPLLVLMTIVGLLLLISAVNLANLLLARASARQKEMGIRLSMGANRWRLIRQLLTESFVLAGTGGALGLMLAPKAAVFLVRFLSSAVGKLDLSFSIDERVLAFTLVTSVSVAMLFGLAPALAATGLDLSPMFKGGASAAGRSAGRARPGRFLVVAQVAISCVLLAGAVLFARSLQTLANLDAGFRPENVLLLNVFTLKAGPQGVERVRLYERVLERLSHVPGVLSVALSSESLFGGGTWTEAVSAPGFMPRPGEDRGSVLLVVSSGFFRTMETTMLRGRDFTLRDDEHAPKVAIVNEAMARYYFGGTDALGRTFQVEHRSFPQPLTVVGVVHDAKYRSLREAAPRIVYLPDLQNPGPLGGASIEVRTAVDPEKMAVPLLERRAGPEPYLRFSGVTTQAHLVDGTIAQDRMLADLSGFFGLAAAALVCLGLYGLTAYEVSRRTAEIGVRIALGAQRRDVMRLVLGGAMTLVAAGVVLGLGAAMGLARLVESLLFGVHSTDRLTMFAVAAMVLVVGAAAAWWPARRAAKLDPIASLRDE